MNVFYCTKEAFTVIGKEGSTMDGGGFVQRLWEAANGGFGQVAHLGKRDADGQLAGIWGAMTDFSRSFLPWEEGFSKGLYLAGIECDSEAQPPEGWTKWTVPGFEYLCMECTQETAFPDLIAYLSEHNIPLAGAVQDFTCPKTGKNYLYAPIRKI